MTKAERLALAIAEFEGYYVTQDQAKARGIPWPTLPQRLKNPMDLVFAGQAGAVPEKVVGKDGKTRIYAKFSTSTQGWNAGYRQMALDAKRGMTYWQFIQSWAPAADDNDPNSYFAFVAAQIGAKPTDKLAGILSETFQVVDLPPSPDPFDQVMLEPPTS